MRERGLEQGQVERLIAETFASQSSGLPGLIAAWASVDGTVCLNSSVSEAMYNSGSIASYSTSTLPALVGLGHRDVVDLQGDSM